MAKRKTHSAPKPRTNDAAMRIVLDPRKIASKLRKSQPPTSKLHRNLKAYKRKPKHPNRTDE